MIWTHFIIVMSMNYLPTATYYLVILFITCITIKYYYKHFINNRSYGKNEFEKW